MWTLGYRDYNGGEFSFSEPFNGGRKLRPLVPRPLPSPRVNGSNFCAQYYHLASLLNEQSKRELNDASSSPPVVVSSSRWNPTPEQLRILEELYRRGTRTPCADQIQHITAQLRRYGKIEGKNVFYWFQNHKARERQKRRRQTAAESAADDIKPLETKHSEAAKGCEIQQTKTNCCWPPSKNCCTTLSEKCVKTQRMAKAGLEEEEEEEEEERRRRDSVERDATWNHRQLINPRRKTRHPNGVVVEQYRSERSSNNGGEESESETTLQLFPLHSTKFCKYDSERELGGRQDQLEDMSDDSDIIIKTPTFSPTTNFQFFEFLPLKN